MDIGKIATEGALGIIIESAKFFGNWRKIMDAAISPVELVGCQNGNPGLAREMEESAKPIV